MSQHNEKNPHQHQSPLHDSSEAHWHLRTDLIVQRLNQHRQVHNLPPLGA